MPSLHLSKKIIYTKEVRQLNNTQEMLLLIKDLSGKMEKVMDHKRYQHTLSVAATASCMAMRFQTDPYQAYLAGLLHDNAKCINNEKKLSICVKNKLSVNPAEEKNPDLLHAKVGSFLAKEKFKIDDEQILSAILWHTTGKPEMTILEKILYIADYMEPLRKPQTNMELVRRLAFEDLDRCMCEILSGTIQYLQDKEATIDEITMETYQFYNRLCREQM